MKVSKHFSREEFKCSCCDFMAVDFELLSMLEDVREHFNSPVNITSACRCDAHNRRVGGADNSMHKKGMACDIVVVGVENDEVQKYLLNKYPNSKGIGLYPNFTHVDVREVKGRWIV